MSLEATTRRGSSEFVWPLLGVVGHELAEEERVGRIFTIVSEPRVACAFANPYLLHS